jgi:hypothetical protein
LVTFFIFCFLVKYSIETILEMSDKHCLKK